MAQEFETITIYQDPALLEQIVTLERQNRSLTIRIEKVESQSAILKDIIHEAIKYDRY